MKARVRWRGAARRALFAVLTVVILLALSQVLVTCGGGDSSGGDGLVWDQGNWDAKSWQ